MKKIEDYLHLYLGCECVRVKARYPYKKGEVIKLDIDTLKYFASDVKPILRPLSSMAEEEAKELDLADVQIGLLAFGHRLQMHMTPDQFKKCLDKHFDLFGLIEEGLAIGSTKTEQLKEKP